MEKKTGIFQKAAKAYTDTLQKAGAGRVSLDFAAWFEPKTSICGADDFARELRDWADREGRTLVIREASMEPEVELDGEAFVCRLGDPSLVRQKHSPMSHLTGTGITHSTGPYLGYKWVYLYKA